MKGYTVLEALVTATVFALCLVLISSPMVLGIQMYKRSIGDMDSKARLLSSFETILHDLERHVGRQPLSLGEISADTSRVAVWTLWTDNGEKTVQYAVRNGTLLRALDGSEKPILTGNIDFEVNFVSPDLAWLSISLNGETLSRHIRLQFAQEESE